MKKLVPKPQNDAGLLVEMSLNERLSSYPLLAVQLDAIKSRYDEYLAARGDPWTVHAPLALPGALVEALKGHYSSPPVCLGFLDALRSSGSPDVCAMCGSLKAGTLDHVFPKDVYPEFAIFAPNLVPACDCNSKRGTRYRGKAQGERALHPYFDDILERRLVYVEFSDGLESPLATIRGIEQALTPEQVSALQFHIESILNRSSLLTWASAKWAALLRKPESLLLGLPRGDVTIDDVHHSLERRLEGADDEHGTPNNWYSMVFYGVLRSEGAVAYVRDRVDAVRAGVHELI